MRVPFGAITIASMLSGAVCARLLKRTCRLVICWPAGTLTLIVEGYGLAGPAVPVPGMAIGLRLLKSVGTVRSSRLNSLRPDRRNGERRGAGRRSVFLFLLCRWLMATSPGVSKGGRR